MNRRPADRDLALPPSRHLPRPRPALPICMLISSSFLCACVFVVTSIVRAFLIEEQKIVKSVLRARKGKAAQ